MYEVTKPQAYQHSCGGYYAAYEDEAGFHRQPASCVIPGAGECHDTPEEALAAKDFDNEWWLDDEEDEQT